MALNLFDQHDPTAQTAPIPFDGDAVKALSELTLEDEITEFRPIFYRPGPGSFVSTTTTETMAEITGVILAVRKARRHTVTVTDDAGNPMRLAECVLDRTGRDGDFGVVQLGQDAGKVRACATCPHNKWGSAVNDKGQRTRGKACREKRLLLVLPDGYAMPIVVSAPPMSIKTVVNWISEQATKGQGISTVKVRLRAKLDQQAVAGELRQYGVLTIETLRALTNDEATDVYGRIVRLRDHIDAWLSSPSLISEEEGEDEEEAVATGAAASTAAGAGGEPDLF
ncbi:MAG: hypothetical protein QJR14_02915 [Bacillota bacterium]|nr:hypothetical protein [Bacillota bacterium]